jgi:hypothetical protein
MLMSSPSPPPPPPPRPPLDIRTQQKKQKQTLNTLSQNVDLILKILKHNAAPGPSCHSSAQLEAGMSRADRDPAANTHTPPTDAIADAHTRNTVDGNTPPPATSPEGVGGGGVLLAATMRNPGGGPSEWGGRGQGNMSMELAPDVTEVPEWWSKRMLPHDSKRLLPYDTKRLLPYDEPPPLKSAHVPSLTRLPTQRMSSPTQRMFGRENRDQAMYGSHTHTPRAHAGTELDEPYTGFDLQRAVHRLLRNSTSCTPASTSKVVLVTRLPSPSTHGVSHTPPPLLPSPSLGDSLTPETCFSTNAFSRVPERERERERERLLGTVLQRGISLHTLTERRSASDRPRGDVPEHAGCSRPGPLGTTHRFLAHILRLCR